MVAVPKVTPVMTPVPDTTLTTAVLLLLQVPPAVLLLSVADEPAHNEVAPVIDPGVVFTAAVVNAIQPVVEV
jgi:hypothetical protein